MEQLSRVTLRGVGVFVRDPPVWSCLSMLGGMILGIIESLGAGYGSSQWKDVIAYLLLIFILIIRPTGLLGERVAEKY